MDQTQKKPTLLYDGECGFCIQWMQKWKKMTGESVVYESMQDAHVRFSNTSQTELVKSVQLILPDGTQHSGAAAVFLLLTFGGQPQWWFLYNRVSWFARLSEFVYSNIAKRRRFFATGVRGLLKSEDARRSLLVLLLSGLLVVFVGLTNSVVLSYSRFIVSDPEPHDVALVLGGGMEDETTMSDWQFDRVAKGIELYRTGKVRHLVMTGDDGRMNANEVGAMQAMAVEQGVGANNVSTDPAGLRTYLSCKNAKEAGIREAIVVSQRFHLPRILYICRRMGINATGVPANLRAYNEIWTPYIRESLARVKAWWQVEISRPEK